MKIILKKHNRMNTEQKESARRSLIRIQNNKCAECKCAMDEIFQVVDHIIPMGLGGDNSLSNLQILCMECHFEKTKEDRIAIIKERKRIREERIAKEREEYAKIMNNVLAKKGVKKDE